MRKIFFLLFIPVISFSQEFSQKEIAEFKNQAKNVTIIRDTWGIPHIYGKTDADAVFGLMYAQCEDNFQRLEENNLEMLGRLSEIQGEKNLYNDLQMRLIYDSSAAINDYKKSPVWLKKLMDAAAAGVNYFLVTHPDVKPQLIHRFEPWFALMRTDGSISATQTGGLTMKDMKNLYQSKDEISYNDRPLLFYETDPAGSNGFAVAPSKTISGNAILYINPHVTFYFRTEVQMVSDEGLNAYGAVTWGTFFVYQGFNEHCGWMHTSSYADVADLFREKISGKANYLSYSYDNKQFPVATREIVIHYQKNGSMQSQKFETYATIHGPVMGSRNGEWLSLKENNRSLEALEQSWLITKATGFENFKKFMNIRSNNSNNTVFADDKGNIAYWHGNFMPKRNPQIDYSLPVDGSISATNWKGIHLLDETVHVYNPSSGWIENCNSTPFTVSGNASPKKENYPAYMAPDGQNYRAINAMRLLGANKDFTIDKMIYRVGFDHYLAAFEILLPPLIKAYDALPSSDSLKHHLDEAISLLRNWDKTSSESSVASTIAIEWAYRMAQKSSPSENPYDASDAVRQITSMDANTSAHEKLEIFSETLADLSKRFGNWKIAWGEINRYQRTDNESFDDRKSSMPCGLAAATWGSIPSFATRRFSNTNKRYGVSGNSFIACVEFGKKVKAKTIVTGGESFDPLSKHYEDQALMFLNGKFKDVFFYKEDVLKNTERKYHPGE